MGRGVDIPWIGGSKYHHISKFENLNNLAK
jgi:hypothetical protein